MSKAADLFARQDLFNQYLACEDPQLSAFHFSSLLAWADFFDFSFEVIDERLCVFAHHAPGSFLYLPPLGGPLQQATLDKCFEQMGQLSISRRVARVENLTAQQIALLTPGVFDCQPKANEYLYRKADIATLSGNAYKAKRHDINHLHKSCQPHYQCYGHEHLTQCLDLYGCWAANRRGHSRDMVYQAMLEDGAQAHALILQHYKSLGLEGRVVLLDGKVCAYSFGYRLNTDTFCVLLEVTDLTVPGLGSFIFQQFCVDPIWQGFEWVNAMDDFGLPNVARAKQSYHPVKLIPSYTIYPQAVSRG